MRVASEASRQPTAAAVAAATAASTTSAPAKATRECFSPVAGSQTSPHLSTGPSQDLPPIQWVIVPSVVLVSVAMAHAPRSDALLQDLTPTPSPRGR